MTNQPRVLTVEDVDAQLRIVRNHSGMDTAPSIALLKAHDEALRGEVARLRDAGKIVVERAERAEAEVARLTTQITRIIGEVQRLQPAGSPPPGGPEILVMWIVATHQAALAAMTAERDATERVARNCTKILTAAEAERNALHTKIDATVAWLKGADGVYRSGSISDQVYEGLRRAVLARLSDTEGQ